MRYSYTDSNGHQSLVVITDTGQVHTVPDTHPRFADLLDHLRTHPPPTPRTSPASSTSPPPPPAP